MIYKYYIYYTMPYYILFICFLIIQKHLKMHFAKCLDMFLTSV